jgi:hypothetical protein
MVARKECNDKLQSEEKKEIHGYAGNFVSVAGTGFNVPDL